MRFSTLSVLAILSAANAKAPPLGERHTDLDCNSQLHEPIIAGKCYRVRIDRTRSISSFGTITCKEYVSSEDCSGPSTSKIFREGCHKVLQQGPSAPRSIICS